MPGQAKRVSGIPVEGGRVFCDAITWNDFGLAAAMVSDFRDRNCASATF